MAHTYFVSSAKSNGDTVTIKGTVDGFPVQIVASVNDINAQPNTTSMQNFIAPLMLQAAIAEGEITVPSVPAVIAAGTFTQ